MAIGGALERRAVTLEIRVKARRLMGYAARFGTEARLGGFTETIQRGAFSESISSGDVVALVDHMPDKLLARTRTKTLRLSEDDKGLAFELDLPDTSAGRDVLALAERGDLGGMSFGFLLPKEGGDRWDGKKRTLVNVALHEISVISSWPAYEGTSVQARNFATSRGSAVVVPPRLRLARLFMSSVIE